MKFSDAVGLKTRFSGFVAGIVLDGYVLYFYYGWSAGWWHSAWMDCPNYVFGLEWYPIFPLPFVFLPLLVSFFLINFFFFCAVSSLQKRECGKLIVGLAGLAVVSLPVFISLVIPFLASTLGWTTPGC